MKEFIDFVAQIMGVDPAEISMETCYKDFEKWDSFMMLTLIMELEERYSISIPLEKIDAIKTLSDLYSLVKE